MVIIENSGTVNFQQIRREQCIAESKQKHKKITHGPRYTGSILLVPIKEFGGRGDDYSA
jgi:hypothetical protein